MEHFPKSLVSFPDYPKPQTRATNRVRDAFLRLRRNLHLDNGEDESDLVPDDLQSVTSPIFGQETFDRLDEHVFGLLDDSFADWVEEEDTPHRVCACLSLPSAPSDLFQRWAESRGHATLEDGKLDGRLRFAVLPSLDPLCERSPSGLERLRRFCEKAETDKTRLLLCGSTIQWSFIHWICGLDLLVSDVRMIPPLDAAALASLLAIEHDAHCFKSVKSGAAILNTEDGEFADDYMIDLAADVWGCPWAALEVFEHSVTRNVSAEEADVTWLDRYDWPALPMNHTRDARFLLHAVLIHGGLAPQDIANVLPLTLPYGLLRALKRRGFLCMDDTGHLRIVPHMASHVHRVLREAGFPVGEV
ncbi:hypothetical protein CLV78_10764 [Aliiruegeria haliotis]|uniref:Uncharacterized protein n=1 Tax=Aliiruegeria haliotis TaxID=1280846 RepID=A0A2T0RLZ0_9RHOB|nr:hypothetical protein [Aliiruegeria haliotis]PRY22140.1 hypothetical protein CLV78_10764 [Aliiruegeria haliotis]